MRRLLVSALALSITCMVFCQEPVVGSPNPARLFTSRDRKLHANKQVVLHIVRDLLEAGRWKDAPRYLSQRYIQHNPNVKSGLAPVMAYFKDMPERPIPKPNAWRTRVVSVVAEGDLVVVATVRQLPRPDGKGNYTTTWFDMWRIRNGKADEHWDGAEIPVPK